jgi:signal transduction histidine kinase/ligand-binding sensor domain-containing protein/CheY-like chemotaxis protein
MPLLSLFRGCCRAWMTIRLVLAGGVIACVGAAENRASADAARPVQPYYFDTYGVELGLPQTNIALAVLQTRDGYLWVGTEGGLARFDGARFVSFRAANTPAFLNNLVHCLFEDAAGDLWIGTERGVIRYRNGGFERMGLGQTSVRGIAQDHQGRIWFATRGLGVFCRDETGLHSFANDPAMLSSSPLRLFVDSEDRLWIGFEKADGLVCREHGQFRRFDDGGRIDGEVQTLCEQPRGTLWFGTRNHRVFRLEGDRLSRFVGGRDGLESSQIFQLLPASDGGLWIAAGAWQKVEDPRNFASVTLGRRPGDTIVAVCEDREGGIWLCAREGGLVRARRLPYHLVTTKEGLPTQNIKSIAEDPEGNIWAGLSRHGIARVAPDGSTRLFERKDGLSGTDPWSVLGARDGSVWAGFHGALCVWRDGHWTQMPEIRGVYGSFEDSHGGIWLGSESHGVARYADGHLTPIDLGPNVVVKHASAFAEGPDGAMYIGTWDMGLVKVQGGHVTVYNRNNGLPADDVRAVHVDRDGQVWIGLRSRGLAVFQAGRWLNPNALSEAVADHVSAITEDDQGRLWLGTPAGVMWAARTDLLAAARGDIPTPRIQIAETSEGAPTAAVSSGAQPIVWRAKDGRFLFATRRGILAIDPERLPQNVLPPPVHIEQVVIDRQPAARALTLEVPAGSRDIEIEYTALSFVQPNRMRFKYKLEGYDRDWIAAGTRRAAYYANLRPGRYVFHVIACNSNGVWNETGDSLPVVQLPHFYQTPWFFGVMLSTSAAFVFGLHRWRTEALRRENEKLNRLVAKRTQELELANTAKSEFLENVSHEIRNPLNGLTGLLAFLKQERLSAGARELVDSVQACAQGLTRVFEEVLGFSQLEYARVERLDRPFALRGMLEEIVRSFAWPASQAGAQVTIELPAGFVDGFEGDENKLKTIVGNFVGNAIKYAPGPIELRVEIHPLAGDRIDVHIEVCDHGAGVPAEEQELIFRKFVRGSRTKQSGVAGTGLGLAACRVLARALEGSVGIDSEPGHGSTFYLCVPLRRATVPADAPARASGAALVVEDERYNQAVLKGIALDLGYTTETAANAEQVAAQLAARRFEVIFLDWELPGLKGGEIARRVRARPDGDQPIIIATTGHASDAIRRQCLDAGMDEFLAKPYSPDDVRQCIAIALARRSRGNRSAAIASVPKLNLRAFQNYARGADGGDTAAVYDYLATLQHELAALERTLAAEDLESAAGVAHRLCALGGLIGADEFSCAAHAVELSARAGLLDESRVAFASFARAAAAVRRDVEAASGSGAPA